MNVQERVQRLLAEGYLTVPMQRRAVALGLLTQAQVDPAAQTQVQNEQTLRQQATNALQNNIDYLALGTPTNAQNVAQIKALTRQMNALIRITVGQLDATS